jgi:predicted anti-sigma-YlaC factor YlaD
MPHEHEHDITCQQLLASLGDYVEGEASEQICREIERHIAECENCRVVVDTLNKTIYLYHQSAQSTSVPQGVHGRLMQALKLDDLVTKKG